MNFVQAGKWKGEANVAHGFGMRCPGEEKPVRKDWLGKPVEAGGESFPLFSLRQVHGVRVFPIGAINAKPHEIWEEEADGLVTRKEGVALGVFTADCLPILLYDPERRAIAVVHAGWRGTALGIARKAVEAMTSQFGCVPGSIQAALGPCIGPCCYEVDGPVKRTFEEGGVSWSSISSPGRRGKWSLDLTRANSLLLEASGLRKEKIEALNLCTFCRQDAFYSYRRGDRARGRQLNFIALRQSAGGIR